MGKLDGKIAIITGAASGIGLATAVRFAAEGAAVVIADLDQEGGQIAVRECLAQGGQAVFQQTDVSVETDLQRAIAHAVGEFGRLDIMYNNAGIGGATGGIETIGACDWDKTFAVLMRAAFLGMKHAVPEMRKAGGGSIISTSSVAGLAGGYGPHAYTAAKAGVINLTRSVALEVARDRIRVNCICPGGINTPIFNVLSPDPAVMEPLLARVHPLQRAGHAEDIAAMALYLASDESQFVTGAVMVVDGGLMAGRNSAADPAFAAGVYGTSGYVGPSFERRKGTAEPPRLES